MMSQDKKETFMIYEERLDHSKDFGTYRHPILIIMDTYENVERFVKDIDFILPQPKWPSTVKRYFSTITTFEGVSDFIKEETNLIKNTKSGNE
jgi:hypothetical protein